MKQSNRTSIYILVIIGAMLLFVFYLQHTISENTQKLKALEVEKAREFAGKIERYMKAEVKGKDLLDVLRTDPEKRKELNRVLHAFLTKEFQYIFLLTKDRQGHYRFVLDASLEDPVAYNTLFFPNNPAFDEVYRTGKPKIVREKKSMEEIWLSLLYPIRSQGKTQMLMVIDLSKAYSKNISSFNAPLIHIAKMMQGFLLLSILFMGYLMFSYNRLQKQLYHDPLTGAYSKYFLNTFFDSNKLDKYDLMMIDIDEFKSVNARFGYDAGDNVLQSFVSTVMEILPKDAKLVRNGGTEFLVIIPKEGKIETIAHALFNILKRKKYLFENEVFTLTVSMSVLETPNGMYSLQKAERMLDERMLEIKNLGKNGLRFIRSNKEESGYFTLDQVRTMLEAEKLLCLYQPVVDTKTGKTVRYEALVRLIDPENPDVLIAPGQFMDIIKGTSQYLKLSKQVLKEVFGTLQAYPNLHVSVNLDLNDLYNDEVMTMITTELKNHASIAHRLSFEILEEHEIKDYTRVQTIFKQLKMYGSQIAIDDFGSGFANYNHVLHLDIDVLKVDGSLIRELLEKPERTEKLLHSIKVLADSFGYALVAEFVSEERIYRYIKDIGFEYAQGYYLGKPEPIEYYEGSLK